MQQKQEIVTRYKKYKNTIDGDRTHDLWVIFGGAGNSEKFNDVIAYEFKTNKWKTLHSGKDLCRYGRNTQISHYKVKYGFCKKYFDRNEPLTS